MTQSYWHIKYEDAITEHCPRCKATPGNPCRHCSRHPAIGSTVMRRCHAERGEMVMLSRRMIPAPQRKQLTDWLRAYGPMLWEEP